MCIHRHAATCTVKRKTSKMNGTSRGICWNWQEKKAASNNESTAQVASVCLPVCQPASLWSLSTTLSLSLFAINCKRRCRRRRRDTHTQSLLRFHCCCRSFFFFFVCQKRYLLTGRRILFYLFRSPQVIQIEDMEILYSRSPQTFLQPHKLCG